jgi:hypothetical protein
MSRAVVCMPMAGASDGSRQYFCRRSASVGFSGSVSSCEKRHCLF